MKNSFTKSALPTKTFPSHIKPMLSTLIEEPFNRPGWLYEIKWNGYRILAFKYKRNVILRSGSGLDCTDRYPAVVKSLKKIMSDFVIDGEVVAFDENGKISFDVLQKANPDAPLTYYVFDLLWVNGYNVMSLTLLDRKRILKSMIRTKGVTKFSEHFKDGIGLYEQANELASGGIVAKKEDSTYQPGKRGTDWLKIPTAIRRNV